jgi:hypothetical protein
MLLEEVGKLRDERRALQQCVSVMFIFLLYHAECFYASGRFQS